MEVQGMEMVYPRPLWWLVASPPAPWGCTLWSILSGDFGVGSFWFLFSVLIPRTFYPENLFFSARSLESLSSNIPAITLFQYPSHLLMHSQLRKEKRNLCDPWKIPLRTKQVPTSPCFVPSAILEPVSFGLSLVGFFASLEVPWLYSLAGSPCLSQILKLATVP